MDRKKILTGAVIGVVLILIMLFAVCPKKKKPAEKSAEPAATAITAQATELPKQVQETSTAKKPEIEFKKTVKKDGTEVLEAVKDGKTVFKKEAGPKEELRVNDGSSESNLPQAGRDLTGDGVPDIFIQLYSEKDSCSNVYSLLSLAGDGVKNLAEVRGLAEGVKFEDLNADKIPELIGHDCTFLDWWASIGETPAPRIILSYKDGKYEVNQDLMALQMKMPPDDKVMQAYINKNKGGFISYVWSYMLDMIYSGYGDDAWRFYEMVPWDDAWEEQMMEGGKQQANDKQSYLEAFKEHLSTSIYWEEIKKLNRWEMMDFEM